MTREGRHSASVALGGRGRCGPITPRTIYSLLSVLPKIVVPHHASLRPVESLHSSEEGHFSMPPIFERLIRCL